MCSRARPTRHVPRSLCRPQPCELLRGARNIHKQWRFTMSNPLPAQNLFGVQSTSRSRPCGSPGTCPEFRMWRFGSADGVVVAQLAQCSPPTAFSPVSNTIQRLRCSYSWAVSYPQCVCHLPYLRKALTWSIPFKLGLFFPSLDPQVSIAVGSLWHLHPFFSRHLTSHNAFQRQLEGPGTDDDRRHDSNQNPSTPHHRHHQPAHLSPKPTRPPTSQRPPPLRLHQR